MEPALKTITGFYGKLPSRGDFVSRGLPRAFLDPWTAWMNDGLRACGQLGGGTAFAMKADAAPWNFSLAPGFAGPSAAAGFFLPSRDRVGREYPLTVVVLLPQCTTMPNPEVLEDWFQANALCASTALADIASPDALFETLSKTTDFAPVADCNDSIFWTLGGRLVMASDVAALRRAATVLLADWAASPVP